jgi:hypothetical protein
VSRKKFLCMDCGVDTGKIGDHYMLWDYVWLSVCDSKFGMLCVNCIEHRLGRRLIAADFNSSYINRLDFGIKSSVLVDRLKEG